MGKMVRWTKRGGWVVAPTPYQYHIDGLHLFQRMRFKRFSHRYCQIHRRPALRRDHMSELRK